MTQASARPSRRRRLLRAALAALALFLVLGVWVSHQFPALTRGPKTSMELLGGLFQAPLAVPTDMAMDRLRALKLDAAVLFVQSCDAPADVKGRVADFLRGDRFGHVTVPFVFYLQDLYGAAAGDESGAADDLGYAEPPAEPIQDGGPGLSTLVRHSAAVHRHAGSALRLFDGLFLRRLPGATDDQPLSRRYDEKSYAELKAVVRELAAEFLPAPSDAKDAEKNEYARHLEGILRDDKKLSDFVEFFTDFTRDLTDSWLQSFLLREKRREDRVAWVEKNMTANRYFEIADYARARAGRRLVLHVAVDGLQGKLLEGLVELSSGDRGGAGARYVEALVKEHQAPEMDPARYGSRLPPALGRDIVELAEEAPVRADYLENFRKYFFAADAPAVVVNVATVDSPSISVRNLPIIYSGHGVAGPHGTGIPNFSYLDRDTGRGWYFWGSDVLHMRDIFGNREDRIPGGRRRQGQGARTLFERLWRHSTASCMSSVDTGALEKISSEVGLAVGEVRRNFIEKVMVLRFRKRAAMERELNRRREWLMDHRGVSDSFLASLFTRPLTLATFRENARFLAEHEDEGLPDYTLWYSPWPDHFAHYTGPYADEIVGYRGEYDRLDFYLGKMIEVYASVPAAGGGGETCADRTLFGVVSDHGLVYTPRLVSIDEVLFAPLASCTYQKLTHDEGGMPAIHRDQGKPTRPFDAVVGSTAGGSYVIDLFGSGQGKGAGPSQAGGDEAAWRRHPDYHEIRSHRLLGGETIDWVETLRARLGDVIDLAVVREYGPGPGESWPREVESAVRLIGPGRGEARIRRHAGPGAEAAGRRRYRYEVLGGRDPLDLLGSVREFLIQPGGPATEEVRRALRECMESEEGCEDGRWEELLSYTLRPDAVHQLSHLYDSDRAGTINLFPLSHVGLNSTVPGRHAGEAFGEKNGVQLYRRTGLRRAALQTARNGSLPVTLYHWLAGDEAFRTPDPASGSPPALEFGYRSLLDEQAFTPIR